MSAAEAAKECIWLCQFIETLSYPQTDPTPLFVDNIKVIHLASHLYDHQRTKHINIKYHFIQEKVECNQLVLNYVSTNQQVAAIFTKPLVKIKFKYFCSRIGLIFP